MGQKIVHSDTDLTGWNWTRLIERIDLEPRAEDAEEEVQFLSIFAGSVRTLGVASALLTCRR